mmetsp:Transcript_30078/g.39974  ORF Transcript_30078/g.39974 Transcript_30078/m.39974 type:complete len:175 (-) Transcript_30078:331-855(-)
MGSTDYHRRDAGGNLSRDNSANEMETYSLFSRSNMTECSRLPKENEKGFHMPNSMLLEPFPIRENQDERSVLLPSKPFGVKFAEGNEAPNKRKDAQSTSYSTVSTMYKEERATRRDFFTSQNSSLPKRCISMDCYHPNQVSEGSNTFQAFSEFATEEVFDTSCPNMKTNRQNLI